MILVTGYRGFIGSYLCPHLRERGYEVVGDREAMPDFDIRDPVLVAALVRYAKPEAVFHLAAQSSVPRSWTEPELTFEVNVLGTVHLLEQVRAQVPEARVVLACSSAEYGGHHDPMSEEHPLKPISPYGASKAAMDLLGYTYFKSYGLDIVRARIFGTIGPGKRGDMVSDFAQRIVSGERPIRVGNLDTFRDLTDVRDTVRALAILMEKGQPGEAYNVCQGSSCRVGAVLDEMIALSGGKVDVAVAPELLRPADEALIVGDNRKIRGLGWEPQIPLKKTLQDVLEWWGEVQRRGPRAGSASQAGARTSGTMPTPLAAAA